MGPLAGAVILLGGWKRLALAMLAGALLVLALQPFGIFPVVFVSFPVLVWLIDGSGSPPRGLLPCVEAPFWMGWCFGFGYFVAGLFWIGEAFLVERDVFGWLLPFGVLGLPALLAIFTGLGAAVARLAWSRSGWRVAALAAGLGLADLARAVVLTGFPWNAFGYAFAANTLQMQAASLVGVYGLGVLGILMASAPAVLADPRGAPSRWLVPALGTLLLAGQFGFGAVRLASAHDAAVDGVALRIVQPNLTQRERLDRSRRQEIVDRLFRLSGGGGDAVPSSVTHLIWPESIFPFLLQADGAVLGRIDGALSSGTVLLTGAARLEEAPIEAGGRRFFNALYAIDDGGGILDRYDKVHLVPFGEYLPFGETLARLGPQTLTRGGFSPGDRRRPIVLPPAPPLLPLICYEIIFSGALLDDDQPRPAWLLNLSDDSWFGDSIGPRQHLQQARLRAVEEGLPVVRATTTGISAVIDPYGRVVASLPLGAAAVLDARLPASVEPTSFSKLRFWPLGAVIVSTLTVSLAARGSLRGKKR